jgi:hypothetical protein
MNIASIQDLRKDCGYYLLAVQAKAFSIKANSFLYRHAEKRRAAVCGNNNVHLLPSKSIGNITAYAHLVYSADFLGKNRYVNIAAFFRIIRP